MPRKPRISKKNSVSKRRRSRLSGSISAGQFIRRLASSGTDQSRIDELFDPTGGSEEDRPRVGLTLTRAIVEQYGCLLKVTSEFGRGTYVQILISLGD